MTLTHTALAAFDDDRPDDVETVIDGVTVYGGPVDPPDVPRTIFATVTSAEDAGQRPIVPGWLRNPHQRRTVAKVGVGLAVHKAAYHASRSPKYAAKLAVFAPVGLVRLVDRQLRWGWLTEQHGLRQAAATRGDAMEWQRLHVHARAVRKWRCSLLVAEAVAVLIAVILAVALAPRWALWTALAGVVLLSARAGAPAGHPLVDRVTLGQPFVKLTGEMVRGALCSIGIARIKEPGDLVFPPPGIHRDGAGWLARVNLPAGVEATDVLERRARLSSALRLPVDQVWPSAGPEHAGQVDLWVGYVPVSKMAPPRWGLTSGRARTSVFDVHEFGTDERQRPVATELFARNFLIGGVPGSGKSYAARTLAMIAALDPTCELKIAEFKGTADFGDLAHLCSTYTCGVDDEALAEGASMIAWGLAEAERRGRRIRAARERGEAPEGKVTPELAAKPGSGLHPVLILVDEAHELLCDKDVAEAAERLIKRGRALGLIVVLATQIPDARSVPPNITRCVNMRWCLAVQDQVSNDMILGTGAYKRGITATAYRPGHDAGWGMFTGLTEPTAVRSHFPTPDVASAMVARATELRHGTAVGTADDQAPARDVVADVIRVFATTGAKRLHREPLAQLLGDLWPETYSGISADTIAAKLKDAGVPTEQVRAGDDNANRAGFKIEALRAAIARREITDTE